MANDGSVKIAITGDDSDIKKKLNNVFRTEYNLFTIKS